MSQIESSQINDIISRNSAYIGLNNTQVRQLQQSGGFNVRPVVKQKGKLRRLWDIVSEPMIALLFVTSLVYAITGEWLEAGILLLSIIPLLLIEFFQEQKTDEAIKALDKMLVEYCMVKRNGEVIKLEIKELVPGDLVYINAGDKIPADGLLFESTGLMIDESMLTGESIAVVKATAPKAVAEIQEENKLYQGTLVTQGDGYFLVTATAGDTTYGKLGNLLQNIKTLNTPLQQKIHRLVSFIAFIALAAAVTIAILLTLHDNFVTGLLGGLTLAMSLIPEEFPVVFSVFLVMGVWRMTKQNALVREMAMVETLGSATVICTDKTGTLTEGKMSINKIYYNGATVSKDDIRKRPTDFVPFFSNTLLSLEQVATDPMEVEVQQFSKELSLDTEQIFRSHTLLSESNFNSTTKLVHHLWQDAAGVCQQHTAGAPEIIIQKSTLNTTDKAAAMAAYESFAQDGYRVIGVAKNACGPKDQIVHDSFEFVGLIAMSDPPRAGVKEAIDTSQKAGIRVIMITGDNKLTAHNIAEAIGLKHNEEIISGTELENLSPAALAETVRRHDIFTRVKPEQKYEIVKALQEMGEVVAMTGDGVNDAPALKKASIGIAMGQKGTEVARAASGIVLLDDNFTTIVGAVREGRRIYENLRQAFAFLVVFHIPIVIMAIVPIIFYQPLIFFPIHIIFLELICDPASVLGFEREQPHRHLMTQKPRPQKEALINPRLWFRVVVEGLLISALSLGLYWWFGVRENNLDLGRTFAFGSLVASQIFLVLFTREWVQVKANRLLLTISAITLILLVLVVLIPSIAPPFHLVALTMKQLGIMLYTPMVLMGTVGVVLSIIRKYSSYGQAR